MILEIRIRIQAKFRERQKSSEAKDEFFVEIKKSKGSETSVSVLILCFYQMVISPIISIYCRQIT